MKRKIRVLFIKPTTRTFTEQDIEILNKYFEVKTLHLNLLRPRLIKDLLLSTIWSDVTYSWFAGNHAFLAVLFSRLFGKKSIVIVGGYDVARIPEIEYGLSLNRCGKFIVNYILNNASKILAVDESLMQDAIKNFRSRGDNISVLPTGYDGKKWAPCGKKENLVIAVGYVTNNSIRRKRYDVFVKAASLLEDVKFVLIGNDVDNSIEYLKSIATSNVEFAGYVTHEELLNYYQRAKVYCQLSRYEGLPNALCEAMLCECTPVGTKYCGIPKAIGDTGYYVNYGDVESTAFMIKKALNSNNGQRARTRIKTMFPIENREIGIKLLIYSLMDSKKFYYV